jgi:hypothetical protein
MRENSIERERSVEFEGVNPKKVVCSGTCLFLDILLSSQASTNRPEGFEISHSV